MERREFLKYVMSLSACACAGCAVSFEKNENMQTAQDALEIVKFPICYHCNLNCAYCSHFSPIAPKYEMPVEVFERDLKQLKKITKGNIKQIALMGGEPLLHKDIKKIIKVLSKHFPDSNKRISTNGLLLGDMDEGFWKICKENNIEIKYSPYTLYKKYPSSNEFKKIQKKYGVILKPTQEKIEKFELINLTKYNKDSSLNYKLCNKKIGCLQINNGKCAPCSVISNIKIFNDYFEKCQLPINLSDYLDIYKISTIEEIFQYLKTPKILCQHCGFGHDIQTKNWKFSSKEISEWYTS